jgi:hypothetical protein
METTTCQIIMSNWQESILTNNSSLKVLLFFDMLLLYILATASMQLFSTSEYFCWLFLSRKFTDIYLHAAENDDTTEDSLSANDLRVEIIGKIFKCVTPKWQTLLIFSSRECYCCSYTIGYSWVFQHSSWSSFFSLVEKKCK